MINVKKKGRQNWTKSLKAHRPDTRIGRFIGFRLSTKDRYDGRGRKFFWANRKLHPYLFCCSSTVTDGRVVRRWPRQRGCSPRRDAHRLSNRSRAARPSFASFDLPATPKTSTTPCSSVLFNSPPASSFGLRMPRILKPTQTYLNTWNQWISPKMRQICYRRILDNMNSVLLSENKFFGLGFYFSQIIWPSVSIDVTLSINPLRAGYILRKYVKMKL